MFISVHSTYWKPGFHFHNTKINLITEAQHRVSKVTELERRIHMKIGVLLTDTKSNITNSSRTVTRLVTDSTRINVNQYKHSVSLFCYKHD